MKQKNEDFYTFFQTRRRKNITLDQLKQLSQDAYEKGDMRRASYYKTRYYKKLEQQKQKKNNIKNRIIQKGEI